MAGLADRRIATTIVTVTMATLAAFSTGACTTRIGSTAPNPVEAATPDAATAAPTTAVPTTAVPTTNVPTTNVPTTTAPTTTAPTTTAPTTTAPTTTAPTTTAATSTTTSTSEPPEPRRITMAFSGDILPHSPLWRQAERNATAAGHEGFDFTPMLVGLRAVHDDVDLAVCHLETPIAPAGEEYSTMPFYGVPAEIAEAIAASGFDRCSTASNHAYDRGVAGIERTVDVLEAAGVEQSGMARRPDEIEPSVFDVDGVAVSHLSYTWSYNGLSLPDDQSWRSALIDPDRILADAARARELGATIVVVSLHWGAEGVHEPTTYQREVAELLTAPGTIDLVVGHHAHVLQPIEQLNGTWVVYGLGNVLSNLPTSDRWPAASQDAAVVTVTASVDPEARVSIDRPVARATWVDRDGGWTVVLVDDELARDGLAPGRRAQLEASRSRTSAVLGDHLAPTSTPGR